MTKCFPSQLTLQIIEQSIKQYPNFAKTNRHPNADRPLINFDMALFLAPMEMSGAVVGVLIQEVMCSRINFKL